MQVGRTFRVFISSTFSDLKAERDALQAHVFPRLRELCEQHGARFQAIDLRWGVSREASRDQRAMNICLSEIERCQEVTPRPNFIVLLGDRYGWCPPPPQIPAKEFESVLKTVRPEERSLVEAWYRRDDNAVPAEYVLQPWDGLTYEAWREVEQALQAALEEGARAAGLDEEARFKYGASATHQEVAAGAMSPAAEPEHVFAFFRQIEGLPKSEEAEDFLDLTEADEGMKRDSEAAQRLFELKADLRRTLGEDNVEEYKVAWTDEGPSRDRIDQLCQDAYQALSGVINRQLAELEDVDPLEAEIAAHDAFGEERARFFTGRTAYLDQIADYVGSASPHPLVIWGEPGSGKSALLANAVAEAREAQPEAEVIFRFSGATPASSNARELLQSLCRQIFAAFDLGRQREERLAEIEGVDEAAQQRRQKIREQYAIPVTLEALSTTFKRFLSIIPDERRLVLFLDALNQLSDTDNACGLTWLPTQLPGHVRIVVSTIPGPCRERLEARLPPEALVELEPLSAHEAEDLLALWLEDAGRTLQGEQRRDLLANRKPLYLKLAFEEARRWHSYDGSPGLSGDAGGVIRDLFGRLSSEANHGEVLVSRSLGYLAAGKNGLTEDELLDILARDVDVYAWFLRTLFHTPPDLLRRAQAYLERERGEAVSEEGVETWLEGLRRGEEDEGREDEREELTNFLSAVLTEGDGLRLPVVLWSRLYADLEPYLTQRTADGTSLLGFYHPTTFGEAVERTYLGEDVREQRHRALAAYFGEQPLFRGEDAEEQANLRKLSELPYQQAHATLWGELKRTLLDFKFLEAKVVAVGPQPLIEDYDASFRAGCSDEGLGLVRGALRLSAHVLDQDRRQLASQLTGRLSSQENGDIQALLKRIRGWTGAPWLRPLTPSLTSPGGALVHTFDHGSSITGMVTLDNGRRVLSASSDGTHRIWNGEKGMEVRTLRRRSDRSRLLGVLPDGRRAVSGSAEGTIEVWDLETEETLQLLEGHSETVQGVEVFDRGRRAISASGDGTLRVWDLESGAERHTLTGHDAPVNAVVVVDGGRRAVSASADWTLRVWDLEAGQTLRTMDLRGHSDPVRALAVISGKRQVVCGSMDGTVRRWDPERGTKLELIGRHADPVSAVTVFDGGRRAMSGSWDGILKMWDLETGRNVRTLEAHPSAVKSVATFDDGRRAVSASANGALQVWDLEIHEDPVAAERVTAMALFPDHRRVLSVANATRALRGAPLSMRVFKIWDLQTGLRLRTLQVRTGWLNAVAVFDGGRRAISASDDKSLRVWDLKSGQGLPPLTGHADYVRALALFDEGRRALSGAWDHTLKLWDLEAWAEVATLTGHTDQVNAVAVFDGGRRAVSGSSDRSVRVWDLEREKEIRVLKGHSDEVEAVAVTPDGRRAISGSRSELKVWDLQNEADGGGAARTLQGHTGVVNGVAVTSDGDRGFSTSSDGVLRMWDLDSGVLIASFTGEGSSLACCAATPNGSRITAGGTSGRVHILEPRGV
ncbi:MAG: AAA family ATPase [Chloroflexota bacterium]